MYRFFASDIFEVKGTEPIYIYDIVPVAAGLASISSDDCLRLLDPTALNGQPLNTIKKVNSDVTCLKTIGNGDNSIVVTAGRDGKVCLIDPRTAGKVGEVQSGEIFFIGIFNTASMEEMIFSSEKLELGTWWGLWILRITVHRSLNIHGKYSDEQIDQGAPILSLACSNTNGIAAGTELTNHQATVSIW